MQVMVSEPLQSWSMPSSAISVPAGLMVASVSLQSSDDVASESAVSQLPSAASAVVPSEVPYVSWSASTMHVMVSVPLQSWSMPSSAISVPAGLTAASPSLQSSEEDDSDCAVSHVPSAASVVVPSEVP